MVLSSDNRVNMALTAIGAIVVLSPLVHLLRDANSTHDKIKESTRRLKKLNPRATFSHLAPSIFSGWIMQVCPHTIADDSITQFPRTLNPSLLLSLLFSSPFQPPVLQYLVSNISLASAMFLLRNGSTWAIYSAALFLLPYLALKYSLRAQFDSMLLGMCETKRECHP